MKILIVYDSVFGNTLKVAQAIEQALSVDNRVEISSVSAVKPEQMNGVDVLIVGSPTRAFSPTKPMTAFLKTTTSKDLKKVKVLSFDTRANLGDVNSKFLNVMVKLFGYAAEPMLKGLLKKGGEFVVSAEGFFVNGNEGPMKDGELERAARWARQSLHLT
jgi:flavodoxin